MQIRNTTNIRIRTKSRSNQEPGNVTPQRRIAPSYIDHTDEVSDDLRNGNSGPGQAVLVDVLPTPNANQERVVIRDAPSVGSFG